MENLIKGWLLSLMGLAGIIIIGVHITGVYEFPNPKFLQKEWQIYIGLIASFGLMLLPKTKLEVYIDVIVAAAVDLVKSIFKKKSDA